jgi:hypothetical protein
MIWGEGITTVQLFKLLKGENLKKQEVWSSPVKSMQAWNARN